jgi:hypothetical protein
VGEEVREKVFSNEAEESLYTSIDDARLDK